MSFGLAKDRELSDDGIGLTPAELPPLPDAIMTDSEAGRVDIRAWFTTPSAPLELEIGVGKGTFLVNQAARAPGTNYLGIEWAHEFYLYSADRLRRRLVSGGTGEVNVRMLHGNGVDFLRWRCPASIVHSLHLYFSDPWPKAKHHKNRVIQDRFLADAWRVLEPGGELRVVTDHDELWAWDMAHFSRWTDADPAAELGVPRTLLPGFVGGGPPFELLPFIPPGWVGGGELVGTNYERKFRREDRPAHACVLRKRPC
jgi:tRNA (guanine-N7-)-methyltransferase